MQSLGDTFPLGDDSLMKALASLLRRPASGIDPGGADGPKDEDGTEVVEVDNPAQLPGPSDIESIAEPWVKVSIVTPSSFIGTVTVSMPNHSSSVKCRS